MKMAELLSLKLYHLPEMTHGCFLIFLLDRSNQISDERNWETYSDSDRNARLSCVHATIYNDICTLIA